jgi:hypothetical protein
VAVSGWTGIVAPAGTPPAVLKRLQEEVGKVLAMPDVRETLSKAGADPVGSTPEQFAAFIRSETVKWGAAVKRAGITPELGRANTGRANTDRAIACSIGAEPCPAPQPALACPSSRAHKPRRRSKPSTRGCA